MTFARRGVLEAHAGRPWTWSERDRMVGFLAEHDFNLFVCAPAGDPLHGERWREPYLPEEVARFARLHERCLAAGIEFSLGTAPLDCSGEAGLAALWGKLAPLHAAGVRSFLLRLDGAAAAPAARGAARSAALAGAHVWLANALGERLWDADPATRLYLCPAETHGRGDSPYLAALGAGLASPVSVYWMGRAPCSPQLTVADARVISATLRRPVLYWDNYPAGDDVHLRLRPVRGREAGLDAAAQGIVAVAGLRPEAAQIPLHTYAAWFGDPSAYEPELAWERALLAVAADPEDASAVGNLGHLCRHSCLEPPLPNPWVPRLAQFWQRWGGVPAAAGPDLPGLPPGEPLPPGRGTPLERQAAIAGLARELTRLRRKAERLLGRLANPALQADLEPWSRKLLGWIEATESAMEALRLALVDPGDARLPVWRERTLGCLRSVREAPCWVGGDIFDQFCRRCLWAVDELAAGGGVR